MGSSHGSDAAIADGLLPYAQQRNSTRNRMSARKCRTSKVVWRWRLPEFFVWGVILSTVMYLLEHTQEYEQEVPAVSLKFHVGGDMTAALRQFCM